PFGGPPAALSAERARRLIPRTERGSFVPQTIPGSPIPYAQTAFAGSAEGGAARSPYAPYAATNPSWSATRGRTSSSSGVWIALAFGLAAIVGGAAAVVLFLALRARDPAPAVEPQIAPTVTAAPTVTTPPAATTTAAPEASIA